jgi:hypothetical protein
MESVLSLVKQEVAISSERREQINNILKDIYDSIRSLQADALKMHILSAKVVGCLSADPKCILI